MTNHLDSPAHTPKHTHWTLYVDGAARNNPGPAGAGIYIEKDGQSYLKESAFLASRTNNQAEYLALLFGLIRLQTLMAAHDTLEIKSDSQLLIRQIEGIYSVKNQQLKTLHLMAKKLLESMRYKVTHIMREYNKTADKLANIAIDKKIVLREFQPLLDAL